MHYKDYDLGRNRVWYRTIGFAEGVAVTGRFFRPDGTSIEATFDEHGEGIYSAFVDLDKYGRWCFLIREDGTPVASETKRVGY